MNLLDDLCAILVVLNENAGPEIWFAAPNEVSRLGLEERVLVADANQVLVAPAAFVRGAAEMRVSTLAVLSDHFAVVEPVLSKFELKELSGLLCLSLSKKERNWKDQKLKYLRNCSGLLFVSI